MLYLIAKSIWVFIKTKLIFSFLAISIKLLANGSIFMVSLSLKQTILGLYFLKILFKFLNKDGSDIK